MFRPTIVLAALPIAMALATAAAAGPVATGSTPAANDTVSKPNEVQVRLSEKVAADGASIELVMISMPGMANHGAMKISGFRTTVADDGKTIVATLPRPLPLGTYSVTWSAGVGADHGEGSFGFTVK